MSDPFAIRIFVPEEILRNSKPQSELEIYLFNESYDQD